VALALDVSATGRVSIFVSESPFLDTCRFAREDVHYTDDA
jgi:hypothetical protein